MARAAPLTPGGRPAASGKRYLVLFFLCLAATIAYVQRQSLVVAESTVRRELGLGEQQMAWVMSSFFITYALFQIPGGWLARARGPRRALAWLSTAYSLCTGLLALAGGLPMLIAARLGMGAGQAGLFPATTLTIGTWFPRTAWAAPSGALTAFMQVGGALGAALTGLLLAPCGWRWLYLGYALPGLAWAAWFYTWFRDRPQEHPSVSAAELALITAGQPPAAFPAEPPPPTDWRLLCRSWPMLCISAQQFCRAAAYMFFGSWFATYLQEARGVQIAASGVLTSLPILATALGSLAGGVLSDRLLARSGSRRLARQGVSVASLLACAALIAAAWWIADVWLAVAAISAGSLCAAFAGPCAYAISIDMGGRQVTSVFATMNMWGNIGAAVFPFLVPWLKDLTGSWDFVLWLFAGIYVLAAACWLAFDPRGTIAAEAPLRS